MKSIIEKLASKELSFGCITSEGVYLGARCENNRPNTFSWPHYILGKKGITGQNYVAEILGHPVYKMHVEQALDYEGQPLTHWLSKIDRLNALWRPLGLSKSLQQIEEESGYEEGCRGIKTGRILRKFCAEVGECPHKRLKDPNARALEKFISNLILTT